MVRVALFIGLVSLAVGIYALVDCLGRRDHQLRVLPKLVWVVLIVVFPLAGPIAYLTVGRGTTSILPRSATPKAPDDDEDFLRQVRKRAQQQRDEYRRQQLDKKLDDWQSQHDDGAKEPNPGDQ